MTQPQSNDWRLTNQETYLKGAELEHRAWKQPRPEWDHDHCEFCWTKFAEESLIPDAEHSGYATADRMHWVCETCFADFREMFEWRIVG